MLLSSVSPTMPATSDNERQECLRARACVARIMALSVLPLATVRNQLSALVEEVTRTHDTLTITRNGTPGRRRSRRRGLRLDHGNLGSARRPSRPGAARRGAPFDHIRRCHHRCRRRSARCRTGQPRSRDGVRYELELARPARRALTDELPVAVAAAAGELIDGPLHDKPARIGTPLRARYEGHWVARRSSYHVRYRIDENRHVVTVLDIAAARTHIDPHSGASMLAGQGPAVSARPRATVDHRVGAPARPRAARYDSTGGTAVEGAGGRSGGKTAGGTGGETSA